MESIRFADYVHWLQHHSPLTTKIATMVSNALATDETEKSFLSVEANPPNGINSSFWILTETQLIVGTFLLDNENTANSRASIKSYPLSDAVAVNVLMSQQYGMTFKAIEYTVHFRNLEPVSINTSAQYEQNESQVMAFLERLRNLVNRRP